jgi:5'-nucleotidase (lipoprotein e(P4) family)
MRFHRLARFAPFGIAAVLVACAPKPTAPAAARPAGHSHENLNAVLWVQTAAEYRALAIQAYRLAEVQLDAALGDPSWTAATEQTGEVKSLPPAVILDLDETVIDNSAFEARLVHDKSPYSEQAWSQWVEERKAGAIPGALEFLSYAKSHGVTPFYVTNRDHKNEAATRDVLAKLGAPIASGQDVVFTRHENGWDDSDKASRRRAAAAKYRVLLLIGDNFEDFISGTRASVTDRDALMRKYDAFWGRRWIVLPNPTYGSWESALTFGLTQPSDEQTLAAKYRALKLER